MKFTISTFDVIRAALADVGLDLLTDVSDPSLYWGMDRKTGESLGCLTAPLLLQLFEEVIARDLKRRVVNNLRQQPTINEVSDNQ
jgi:hypothetical protein